MKKHRLSTMVAVIAAMSTMTACGSSSSHTTTASTSKNSTKTSSAYEGQEGPTNNDAAVISQVKPLPNAGTGWVLRQPIVGYGTDTIATKDDSSTKITGLSDQDGKAQWTIDLTKPPAPLTVSQGSISTQQIGSSIAVHWGGTSGGSSLDTGQPTEETAVYDLNTGKLRGKPWVNTPPIVNGSIVDTSLGYAYKTVVDDVKYILQDGSVDTNGNLMDNEGTYTLDLPGQDTSIRHTAQDVDSTSAIVTWTDPTTNNSMGQFYDRKTKQMIGQPVSCKGTLPLLPSGETYESPDKKYINSGPFIADTKNKKMTCLQLPTNNLQDFSLSNTGVIYANANNKFITMPLGSTKPSFITTTNQMPGLSLAHADIYAGIPNGSTTSTSTVVFPKK